jgi:hypothetical protein
MGVWGAGGARAGWAGLGWAGLARATSRIETHNTHDYQTDSNREPKNRDGTRRTRNIRQRNVLRHDATPMTLRFCSYTTRTPVTIQSVTPKFGERKEEKILPSNSGRYSNLPKSEAGGC